MELPADAIGKILTAMVKQCPFDTAGEAGRSLLNCGLVNKTWRDAATHEAVWRALYLRCSPAHVRARDGHEAQQGHAEQRHGGIAPT